MGFKNGNIPWNKGKTNVYSEEHKRKISDILKGRHTSPKTELKKGHTGYWKGKHLSEEHKRNIAKGVKKRLQLHPYPRGKYPSEQTRELLSQAMYRRWQNPDYKKVMHEANKGEKCYLWRGGISYEPYGEEFNEKLKEKIRQRDGYVCQECGRIENEFEEKLHVHHIDYDKRNNNANNLISLCRSCHSRTNNRREEWTKYLIAEVKGVARLP